MKVAYYLRRQVRNQYRVRCGYGTAVRRTRITKLKFQLTCKGTSDMHASTARIPMQQEKYSRGTNSRALVVDSTHSERQFNLLIPAGQMTLPPDKGT